MHPEDDSIVDDSLAVGPLDDYSKPYSEKCEHCGGAWHGQPSSWNANPKLLNRDRVREGCPGAYATDEQVAQWHKGKVTIAIIDVPNATPWMPMIVGTSIRRQGFGFSATDFGSSPTDIQVYLCRSDG